MISCPLIFFFNYTSLILISVFYFFLLSPLYLFFYPASLVSLFTLFFSYKAMWWAQLEPGSSARKLRCESLQDGQWIPGRETWWTLSLSTDWGEIAVGLGNGIKGILGEVARVAVQPLAEVCCLVVKSCLTLCDLKNCSPPGSSVCGILQAEILERVAIFFSRRSSPPRDWTQFFCLAGGFFTTVPPGKPSRGVA